MGLNYPWNLTFSFWAVSFIALLSMGPTNAAQCRQLKAVQDSMATLDMNVALGGHVWIHVYGSKDLPSKEKPEVNKTMWINDADRLRAWNAWKV